MSNPLVALIGSAELALDGIEPGSKLHDRVALMERAGTEVAEIVRALQAFIRLQSEPSMLLSVGEAAADAVALVTRVMPTPNVELRSNGDATAVARPGEIRRRLVELLLTALGEPGRTGTIELTVGEGVVTVSGGGEVRL
ncbi:MAG: hypothetical protein ACXWZB_07785 [Gaiellaceae bacterium]